MGSEKFVFLEMGVQRIIARAGAGFRVEPESSIWFEFDMSKAHFFDGNSGVRL